MRVVTRISLFYFMWGGFLPVRIGNFKPLFRKSLGLFRYLNVEYSG